MILLIDSYDSFVYNLYQYLGTLTSDVRVIRNDELSVEEIAALQPEAIVLSPGPGRPEDAGVIVEVVKRLGHTIPILGVCLGHQAICQAFGATVSYAKTLMHGKASAVTYAPDSVLFEKLGTTGVVARYHSLAALPETMPEELLVTALTEDNEVMAVCHREHPIFGVQFHPESILTEGGLSMLEAFLAYARVLAKRCEAPRA